MNRQLRDLTRDVLRDVRSIGSVFAGRTKRHTEAAVEETAPAGALLGLGLIVASVGGVLLLATPIVPERHRRMRMRMFAVSSLYLIAGGAAAAIGTAAARDVLRRRVRHVARDVERGTETVAQQVEQELR